MDFKLPDIGEGVHEGEITKWLVNPGDAITADQPMVEVMTDKATVEIPSPVSGTVAEVFAKEGQTVEVGKVIVKITEGGSNGKSASAKAEAPAAKAPAKAKVEEPEEEEEAEASEEETEEVEERKAPPRREEAPRAQAAAPKAPAKSTEARGDEEVLPFHILATPATRKLARDLEVDLKAVPGSGPNGRITKVDVQMAYEGHQAAAQRPSHPAPASTQLAPASPTATKSTKVSTVSRGTVEVVPLKGIRKKISEAMAHSKRTVAHFTYVEEVDMTEVVKWRAEVAEEAKKRNIKLTYLPFIIKAVIPALKEFPYLNASLDDEKAEILLKGDYNIGIATDTPNGLMVPVVKAADAKSIWELASEIAEVTEKTRNGKASLDELRGGTFTVTNAGSIGGVFTTPVVNHPEVAILGVNAIRKRPMVVGDQIAIRDMMYLSLSVDHRVADGADAARFINRVVYFLTDPKRLVFA